MGKEMTMSEMIKIFSSHVRRMPLLLFLGLVAGCAGTRAQSHDSDAYVEVSNPAQTMSPTAPRTIWVPRTDVESGIQRGGELMKQGYEAVTKAPPAAVAPAGITAPGGKPAPLVPHFGLVVALDGEKVFFNLGRDAGITPLQRLKVYRGGTIIEGLGLAPGELVATIEVQGFVGTGGAYGLIRQGGQLRINDLVGAE
jgi:hypothetical protein